MGLFWWFQSKHPRVLRAGFASRVVFYYPGEDGTFLDNAWVRVFETGVVDINHPREQVTTHIQNVEIVWRNARGAMAERNFVLHTFDRSKDSGSKTKTPESEDHLLE